MADSEMLRSILEKINNAHSSQERSTLIQSLVNVVEPREYEGFVESFIQSKTMTLEEQDKIDLIKSVKNLSIADKKIPNNGMDFTEFEDFLFRVMTNTYVGLEDSDKVKLIEEERNFHYTTTCLSLLSFSSKDRFHLIGNLGNLDETTQDAYFLYLDKLVTNHSDMWLNHSYLAKLVSDAQKMKRAELNTYDPNILVDKMLSDKNMNLNFNDVVFLIKDASQSRRIMTKLILGEYPHIYVPVRTMAKLISDIGDSAYIENLLNGREVDAYNPYLKRYIIAGKLLNETKGLTEEERDKYSKDQIIKMITEDVYDLSEFQKSDLIADCEVAECKEYALANFQDINSKWNVVMAVGGEDEKNEWKKRVHQIDNISELDIETLEAMPDDTLVRIVNKNTTSAQQILYTKNEYLAIHQKLDAMLEGIRSCQ